MRDLGNKMCFVAMPIGKPEDNSEARWRRIYDSIIKPGIKNAEPELTCYRADDNATANQWWPDVLKHLRDDFLCIADVTGRNHNVYYELGIRDSWHNRTIVIAQSMEDLAADRRSVRALRYHETDRGTNDVFSSKIREAVQDIIDNPSAGRNPVQEFLSGTKGMIEALQRRLSRPVFSTALFDMRVSNVLLAMGARAITGLQPADFFRSQRLHNDTGCTMFVVLKVLDPKRQPSNYIAEFLRGLSQLRSSYNSMYPPIQFGSNALPDLNPEPKTIVFIVPLLRHDILGDELTEHLRYHFDNRPATGPAFFPVSDRFSKFHTKNGNVDFQLWDGKVIKQLETKFRLTVSRIETAEGRT